MKNHFRNLHLKLFFITVQNKSSEFLEYFSLQKHAWVEQRLFKEKQNVSEATLFFLK